MRKASRISGFQPPTLLANLRSIVCFCNVIQSFEPPFDCILEQFDEKFFYTLLFIETVPCEYYEAANPFFCCDCS